MTSRFDRLFGIQEGIRGALLSVIDVTSTQIRRFLIIVFWDAPFALPYTCTLSVPMLKGICSVEEAGT